MLSRVLFSIGEFFCITKGKLELKLGRNKGRNMISEFNFGRTKDGVLYKKRSGYVLKPNFIQMLVMNRRSQAVY